MRYRRANTLGGTFFFTVVTYSRQPLFDDQGVGLLRQSVREVKRRHPFHMDAVVVLPDHVHAIWTLPQHDGDFSTRWMLIKSAFSRSSAKLADVPASGASRSRKRERAVWQRRFWEHQIRDEQDYASHMDYIHYNPVKHGLVNAPRDWAYSSFRRHVRLGLYSVDWGAGVPPLIPDSVGAE